MEENNCENSGTPVQLSFPKFSSSLPNAITKFTQLKNEIGNKKLFIFLDYDGTLTPIVSHPKDALIPSHTLKLLFELSSHHFVAIVTGRSKETIRNFINLTPSQESPIALLTSHGFCIECSNKKDNQTTSSSNSSISLQSNINYIVGSDKLPYLQIFKDKISNDLQEYNGVNIEDNSFSLSIHYRHVKNEQTSMIEQKIDTLLISYPMLKKTFGKKVFEIRLNFEWDKGKAIIWLLNSLGYNTDSREIFPIYLGDDITDEDAFKELNSYFHSTSILVSQEEKRQTYASQRLEDPDQVYEYLKLLKAL